MTNYQNQTFYRWQYKDTIVYQLLKSQHQILERIKMFFKEYNVFCYSKRYNYVDE